MFKSELHREIDRAHLAIAHTTDGPVTRYVMICRAIEAARAGRFRASEGNDPLVEALVEALGIDGADDD